MKWEFEHWDNGKVYLHNERWENFRKSVDKHGYGYPHDWNHTRIFTGLLNPRDTIDEVPAPGDPELKYRIESVEEWTVIYEPFPAFVRTADDPEGWLPSWHLWAEDRHKPGSGETLAICRTGGIYRAPDDGLIRISFSAPERNYFGVFRGKVWNLSGYVNYGIGANEPPAKVKKKVLAPRSIFEPFEESW